MDIHYIKRHKITDLDKAKFWFDSALEDIDEDISECHTYVGRIGGLERQGLDLFRYGSVIAPGSPEQYRGLKLAQQALVAQFAFYNDYDQPLPIEDRMIPPPAEKPNESMMHDGRWQTAFSLSLLCRDMQGLELLCDVPVSLLQASSTKSNEYHYLFTEACQLSLTDHELAMQKLEAAIDATDSNRYQLLSPNHTRYLDLNYMMVLAAVLIGQQDMQTPLIAALEDHKTFWSEIWDNGENAASGFLACQLMAYTAIALDHDIDVAIDSEYFPMDIVSGEFLEK